MLHASLRVGGGVVGWFNNWTSLRKMATPTFNFVLLFVCLCVCVCCCCCGCYHKWKWKMRCRGSLSLSGEQQKHIKNKWELCNVLENEDEYD